MSCRPARDGRSSVCKRRTPNELPARHAAESRVANFPERDRPSRTRSSSGRFSGDHVRITFRLLALRSAAACSAKAKGRSRFAYDSRGNRRCFSALKSSRAVTTL